MPIKLSNLSKITERQKYLSVGISGVLSVSNQLSADPSRCLEKILKILYLILGCRHIPDLTVSYDCSLILSHFGLFLRLSDRRS